MINQLQEVIYSDEEIYLDISGYEGSYQVSNHGNIKSIGRTIEKVMYGGKIGTYFRKEKILKPGINEDYLHVTLRKDNRSKQFKAHRLVLETFKPCENSNLLQANHKDGNKRNNHKDNLEWLTQQNNQLHRYQELYNDKKLSKHSYITKVRNRWRLRGFKNKHIGYFETEELAKEKYDSLVESNPELFKSITSNDLF